MGGQLLMICSTILYTTKKEAEEYNFIQYIKYNSDQVIGNLRKLKDYINSILPKSKVILSSQIMRLDNAKAWLTVLNVNKQIIINSNSNDKYLGKKRLYLVPHGTGKLVVNFIKCVKTSLQQTPNSHVTS